MDWNNTFLNVATPIIRGNFVASLKLNHLQWISFNTSPIVLLGSHAQQSLTSSISKTIYIFTYTTQKEHAVNIDKK